MSEIYTLSNSKSSLFRNRQRFALFLFFYFVIMLLPAYWLDVFETTDARYAEIAREMMASGNYLEPFYNGIKHFHKPPFTYWITALGMHIFGINGLGARFFGAAAAVITLIFARKLAVILTDDDDTADKAVLVLGSSALFMIVGRIVSTDIYLTCFTVIALYFLFKQIYGEKSMKNSVFMSIAFGLGFLTKGPVIFLFTLLPFFTAKFFSSEHRRVFSPKEIAAGVLIFLAIALPWYIYVISVNEHLLNYFLYDQTVDRVSSGKFNRSQPIYFLPMIFILTLFPFIIFFFKNIRNSGFIKPGRVLYLYILMPFIVFEISTSKLPSYILPFYPLAAVLSAGNISRSGLMRYTGYVFLFLSVVLSAVPFFLSYLRPFAVYITPAGILLSCLIFYIHFRGLFSSGFTESVSASLIMITLTVFFALTFIGDYFKGYRMMAEDIKRFDGEGRYPVAAYYIFAPSLSFYLNDITTALKGKTRETLFQNEDEVRQVYRGTEMEIAEYFSENDEFIVVTQQKYVEDLLFAVNRDCEEISRRGGRKVAFFCKRK